MRINFAQIRITNHLVKILLFVLLLFPSCLNQNKQLREKEFLERINSFNEITSKYCISLGLNFSRENPIKSEMFFRCKIELAKKAKISSALKPQEIIFNNDLKKFIELQDQKYMNSVENLNYYRNSILNNAHHNICQRRGYNFDSLKQEEIEDYLSCRERLIMSFEIQPAYRNSQDLNYPQSSYNTAYIINKKQDQEIKETKEFAKNFPFCSNLKVNSPEAIQCKNAFNEKESCIEQVKKESYSRKRRFQEICQQKLYIKFPDSLLIEKEKKQTRAQRKNFNTDLYLNSSYYEFLSNKKLRESFMFKEDEKDEEEQGQEQKQKQKQKEIEAKIDNTFSKMYTRHELTSLRTQFINSCMSEVEPKVKKFVQAGLTTCRSITLKWDNKSK